MIMEEQSHCEESRMKEIRRRKEDKEASEDWSSFLLNTPGSIDQKCNEQTNEAMQLPIHPLN